MGLNDRLSWVSVAVLKWGVVFLLHVIISAVLNKVRATLSLRDGNSFVLRVDYLSSWFLVGRFPVSLYQVQVCWIQSQGSLELQLNALVQMTKTASLSQKKAHLKEMAQKVSFLLFLMMFLHKNLTGLLISFLSTLLRNRPRFCCLGHLVLCILSKSVAITIHRLGKASRCTDAVGRRTFLP